MKTIARVVWLIISSTSLCAAQTNAPVPAVTSNTVPHFPTNLTTIDGKRFSGVLLRRFEPDGIVIDYTLDGGGIGLAKLKFKNLPEDFRKRWGYDAEKAVRFEASRIQDAAEWRQKMIDDEEAARVTRSARELAQLEADLARAEAAVKMAELRMKELEAEHREAEIRALNFNLEQLQFSVERLKRSVDWAAWPGRF